MGWGWQLKSGETKSNSRTLQSQKATKKKRKSSKEQKESEKKYGKNIVNKIWKKHEKNEHKNGDRQHTPATPPSYDQGHLTPPAHALLRDLLVEEPEQRIRMRGVLEAAWFQEELGASWVADLLEEAKSWERGGGVFG